MPRASRVTALDERSRFSIARLIAGQNEPSEAQRPSSELSTRANAERRPNGARWAIAVTCVAAAPEIATKAFAQESTPAEGARALASLIHVSAPTPPRASVVTAAGVRYGWLDSVGNLRDGGHRVGATLSAALSPLPWLSVGADVSGRLDAFDTGPNGSETNLYGEPRLTARVSRAVGEDLYWGAEADVRLVGAEAPSVHLPATSPSLRALIGRRVAPGTFAAAQLGFHLDRSARLVDDPSQVSAVDRRTLSSSSFNAVQWGAGVSHRLSGPGTELIGELSGEWLVGESAPPFFESPLQLSVGARHPLGSALALLATVDVGLSARPDGPAADELSPVGPRAAAALSLVWRANVPQPSEPSTREPEAVPALEPAPTAEPAPPPVATSSVSGTVVDEGGRPLSDVVVSLSTEGGQPVQTRTLEGGGFEFPEVAEGPVSLTVSTAGFEEATLSIAAGEDRQREIVLHLAVPAGQVRGKVLDLSGNPVGARVRISPGEHLVEVAPDGSFTLELSPGRYDVAIEHPGFATQRRTVVVVDRGVVILNIALSQ